MQYVYVARSNVTVTGSRLSEGDGARVRREEVLSFVDGQDAEVLAFLTCVPSKYQRFDRRKLRLHPGVRHKMRGAITRGRGDM
jgi:hypothetical protein